MKAQMRLNIMQGYGDTMKNARLYEAFSADTQLDRAADDTCYKTDCYFSVQQEALVANQAIYCAPKVYKPKNYEVIDINGNTLPLGRDNTRSFNNRFPQWQSWVAQDPPNWVVQDGLNYLTLAPTPSMDRANGLIITGFCASTLPKAGHTNHQWDLDTDECPLPQIAHSCVVAGGTFYKLQQMISQDPKVFGPLAGYWKQQWDEECNRLAVWAAKEYASMRLGGYNNNTNWYGGYTVG